MTNRWLFLDFDCRGGPGVAVFITTLFSITFPDNDAGLAESKMGDGTYAIHMAIVPVFHEFEAHLTVVRFVQEYRHRVPRAEMDMNSDKSQLAVENESVALVGHVYEIRPDFPRTWVSIDDFLVALMQ
ncbi:hypothetical protein B0H11DRAFT_2258496 [Mycena galericulata]|nr:hypothetical protein B0H11DRAFT_2258496 [Mycena galericulata]